MCCSLIFILFFSFSTEKISALLFSYRHHRYPWEQHEFPPGGISWANTPITFHVYVVDRTNPDGNYNKNDPQLKLGPIRYRHTLDGRKILIPPSDRQKKSLDVEFQQLSVDAQNGGLSLRHYDSTLSISVLRSYRSLLFSLSIYNFVFVIVCYFMTDQKRKTKHSRRRQNITQIPFHNLPQLPDLEQLPIFDNLSLLYHASVYYETVLDPQYPIEYFSASQTFSFSLQNQKSDDSSKLCIFFDAIDFGRFLSGSSNVLSRGKTSEMRRIQK